eukprot:10338210-Lingulodinium_polyedra.AAC.1
MKVLDSLEAKARKRARETGETVIPARDLAEAFTSEVFAKATDWNVFLSPGVHLRYACAYCHEFP